MDSTIKGWLVYNMTGSAADLGLVCLAGGVPLVLASFFGGVVADRVDKHKFLLFTQGVAALIALITAILIATKLIQFWHFIVLAVFQGTIFAFIAPLRQSIIARLVSSGNLLNAVALSSTSFNIMGIVGPAAVGMMLIFMPPDHIYYIIVGLFTAGAVLLLFLQVPRDMEISSSSFTLDLVEGFRFIRCNRGILALLLIALIPSFLCIPYIYMMPALAIGTLKVGQAGLGFLLAVSGAGALIGSLVAGSLAELKYKGAVMLLALLALGLGISLSAQFQFFPLVLFLILCAAFSCTAYMTLNNTLILAGTPYSMQGRIISIFIMTSALIPIGALPMGAVVDHIGLPYTFMIVGFIAVSFTAIMWFFVPAVKEMR